MVLIDCHSHNMVMLLFSRAINTALVGCLVCLSILGSLFGLSKASWTLSIDENFIMNSIIVRTAFQEGRTNNTTFEGNDSNAISRKQVAELTHMNITKLCFPHNSEQWLTSSRQGNLRDTLMTKDFIRRMILDSPSLLASTENTELLLNQSLCHDRSRFLNLKETEELDKKSLRIWAVRLIYMSIHYHQHRPAMAEAKIRMQSDIACQIEAEKLSIGPFDYECPDTKFLIVTLGGMGIGANMRSGAVAGLMAGLASNRTVLFIKNAPVGNVYVRNAWDLASCDRKDPQCFFMPLSPCVLRHDELANIHEISRGHMRRMLKKGLAPPGHEDDRVLYLPLHHSPPEVNLEVIKSSLYNITMRLLDAAKDKTKSTTLRKAARLILRNDKPQRKYNFGGASSKVNHALLFYAMRPNLRSARKVNAILKDILPAGYDPEHAIGLPIRASDKCHRESECLSFMQHMEVVSKMWKLHSNLTAFDTELHIIMTTESPDVVHEQRQFAGNASLREQMSFSFQFVTNKHDVTPGTGKLKKTNWKYAKTMADEAMLSAISSLKAQLSTRITIGNCCSNFHTLLADFLSEGCGAAFENTFHCLQEDDDPQYVVCCGWHHHCKEQKRQKILARTQEEGDTS